MGINLNFDPTDPFGRKADKRYQETRESSEEQRRLDNIYRQQMRTEDHLRYNQARRDQLNRIQNLKVDAQKAGVSLMAALGSPGSSPAHVTMPAGQGGRAAGLYQRKSSPELLVSANLAAQSNIQTESQKLDLQIKELQYFDLLVDVKRKNRSFNQDVGLLPPQDSRPSVYVNAMDNYNQAVEWIEQGGFPILNPELNLEMPESVGGYYFAKPRPEGWISN